MFSKSFHTVSKTFSKTFQQVFNKESPNSKEGYAGIIKEKAIEQYLPLFSPISPEAKGVLSILAVGCSGGAPRVPPASRSGSPSKAEKFPLRLKSKFPFKKSFQKVFKKFQKVFNKSSNFFQKVFIKFLKKYQKV